MRSIVDRNVVMRCIPVVVTESSNLALRILTCPASIPEIPSKSLVTSVLDTTNKA
jgi:hypothetical protein